ncbi:uncharacterized protein LOC142330216 isoform X2 [Lycorma delicatula]|uniref:uncharacterized protein LOC142330216 isoform X2 n=1 Tax=Lycorma delicatula TaxID=130591 RepID=UPI003F517059
MTNNLHDIFKTLDLLSEFSRGQPRNINLNKSNCKAINSASVPKIQTLKTDNKKQDKKSRSISLEEKEFARQIGYELNSDDDNASDVYDDDDGDDVSNFKAVVENNSPEKHFKENGSNFNCKKDSRSSGSLTGFTVGRGQWLNTNSFPLSTFSYNKSSLHHNRQEQNDRVISEQLREVVGVGLSNEEIENDFALKFKKKSSKETQNVDLESNHKKEKCAVNNSDSFASSNSKHKHLKCNYELYLPPALRSKGNNVSESERKCMVSNSVDSDSCSNVPNYSNLELKKDKLKTLSPIKLDFSKVNIYECNSDCIELENNSNHCNPSSSQTNNDSDNTKNIVIDTNNSCNGEKQTDDSSKVHQEESKLSFRMKSKELLNKSSKFGGGRNALINGLLKKLAKVEENKEAEEKKEVTVLTTKEDNLEVNNGNIFENYYTFKEQSDDYDLSSFDGFNSINSDSSNNVSRCVSRNSVSCSCSQVLDNSTASTTTDITYPTTSKSTDSTACSKPKKTYVELILKSSQKLKNITLADFIPENMLNITAEDSDLNPNANEFNPQLDHFLNPNAVEFNPCYLSSSSDSFCADDFNFPPLK